MVNLKKAVINIKTDDCFFYYNYSTARSIAHNTSDSSFADTCPGALAFPMLPKLITLPNKPPQSLLTHPVRPIDIVIKSVSG